MAGGEMFDVIKKSEPVIYMNCLHHNVRPRKSSLVSDSKYTEKGAAQALRQVFSGLHYMFEYVYLLFI